MRSVEEARTLARFILENAEKYEWTLQGFGMLRLYLPSAARLHVWDQRHASPGVSTIHDHLQWGLTSTILSGRLVNTRYRPDPQGIRYSYKRIKAGVGTYDIGCAGSMRLKRQPQETYRPGDTYHQEPEEIHETAAVAGTVTLMQKHPSADGETARVFWPPTTIWRSAEARVATPEEVRAITGCALDNWSPSTQETK